MTPYPSYPKHPAHPDLLGALPDAERERLLSRMERVDLELGDVLWRPNEPAGHVYFPIDSLISQLTLLRGGQGIESGVIGREGVAGLWTFLGRATTPHQVLCQIPGSAWRIRVPAFVEVTYRSNGSAARPDNGGVALAALLQRYAASLINVSAQIIACNRAHASEQRGARWLLMAHDRAGRDEFRLTHEFFAQMLGVRRATVSEVLGIFAHAELIAYHRGQMTILDRVRLEAVACECYAAIRSEEWRAVSPD